jgi:hypothetical protein
MSDTPTFLYKAMQCNKCYGLRRRSSPRDFESRSMCSYISRIFLRNIINEWHLFVCPFSFVGPANLLSMTIKYLISGANLAGLSFFNLF